MVTMKDIAREAKVSIQTVSNVINNRGSQISEKTRKTILELVEKFDYKPSRIARNLRSGNTKTIGLVVPHLIYHPVYAEIFDIIENELNNQGFGILLFNTREDLLKENKAIETLLESKVDGIIFIRIIQRNPLLEKLPRNIPVVACLRAFEMINVPSVLVNNKKAGFLATEYLIKKGHKNIIHIEGNKDLLAHRERKFGYIEALKKHGLEVDEKYIITGDYKKKDLYKELLKKLKGLKDYTAVFAYNDIVAVNCIKALGILGFKVPDDISIIGIDNLEIGNFVEPYLTTIAQPIEEVCSLTVELLIDLINNKDNYEYNYNKVLICNPKLVVRDSVIDINKK
jgi:DNA-binding LacI/PurR family transcriptional regulator